MTIRDAIDLNNLLRHLLAIPREGGRESGSAEALDAARRLIGRANKALSAGLNPDQVERHWPAPNRRKKGPRKP